MDIPLGAAFINVVAYVFAAMIITLEIPRIVEHEGINKFYDVWGNCTYITIVLIPLYVVVFVEGL